MGTVVRLVCTPTALEVTGMSAHEVSARGQLAGLRTRGHVLLTGGHLLAVASQAPFVGPSADDGGRSHSPLRGSPGFPPGSLLRRIPPGGRGEPAAPASLRGGTAEGRTASVIRMVKWDTRVPECPELPECREFPEISECREFPEIPELPERAWARNATGREARRIRASRPSPVSAAREPSLPAATRAPRPASYQALSPGRRRGTRGRSSGRAVPPPPSAGAAGEGRRGVP